VDKKDVKQNQCLLVPVISTQPVVNVKNIIIVLIVVAIIMSWFAGLCQNPTWVMRRFVSELRITNTKSIHDMSRQLSNRLRNIVSEIGI